ncbi:hypothetical protein APE_0730 [Aeropyrum pernix ovoid virus 1]|uniref:Uncharacterized protein n=2 Tax=root TaxID=1 RepID=Q9YE40_AERPE|nr:hypothetical protein [Aeropyrum pernix]YP_009177665.1 hypothetical protein ASQ65_gp14 [Aeropyrum pernix ovoid virus 1]BAA79706.1 hypothetical protein APE_0730 [Aeropyrum pernix ovoid virus 1] [Aeropyrum pernix K1]CCD22155.1 TPA: hypothetical protein [Aeropyrum pernix ovoid virus 1]
MPVYQGPKSCYARKEGVYVRRARRPGIDTLAEAAAIAKLILRDLRRGYTYENRSCKRIKMTKELAVRRLNFLKLLARRHRAPRMIVEATDFLVEYVLREWRLPRGRVSRLARTMIVRRSRV